MPRSLLQRNVVRPVFDEERILATRKCYHPPEARKQTPLFRDTKQRDPGSLAAQDGLNWNGRAGKAHFARVPWSLLRRGTWGQLYSPVSG